MQRKRSRDITQVQICESVSDPTEGTPAIKLSNVDDFWSGLAQIAVDDVLWLGYANVILKSDNEPALVKLLKAALSTLKVSGVDQVGEEHSPPYDSQVNGSVENAVKLLKARMRTLKLCLERRIGKRISPRHPIMSWLAPHAAAILRYRSRGDDGKTPHEMIRLRPFDSRLVALGERCGDKLRSKEPTDEEHKWYQGIFLGI